MATITLVLGGARSGKSTLAEKFAKKRAGQHDVLYGATREPRDDEMRGRILHHQASRPSTWRTLEAPFKLTDAILDQIKNETLILIDCLTVWSSNHILEASGMLGVHNTEVTEDALVNSKEDTEDFGQFSLDYQKLEEELTAEIDQLISEVRKQERDLIMVSNEVGMGLVPPYLLGRAYRDLLGRLNQHIAAQADEVFMVLVGIPIDLKRLQAVL